MDLYFFVIVLFASVIAVFGSLTHHAKLRAFGFDVEDLLLICHKVFWICLLIYLCVNFFDFFVTHELSFYHHGRLICAKALVVATRSVV
jgi:hypothetical protein